MYLYVGNQVLLAIDPSGFWKKVGGDLWKAENKSETFAKLVKMVAPSLKNPKKNAACITPTLPVDWEGLEIRMKSTWEKKKPACGGVYDWSSP